MEKRNNKILIVLIVLLSLFAFKVKALTYKVGDAFAVINEEYISSGFNYGVGGQQISRYSGGGTNVYCLDPSGYGDLDHMRIDRELVYNSSATGRQYAYETALMEVLKKSSSFDYRTITHSLRFVKSSMGLAIAGDFPGGKRLTQTFMVTGASWISESTENYTAWYQSYYGTNPSKALSGNGAKDAVLSALYATGKYSKDSSITSFTGDATMMNNIKSIFISALKAAAKARMNGNSAEASNYKLSIVNNGTVSEITKNGDAYLSRDIVYVVNTSLYNKSTGFVGGFNVTSNYSNMMTLQYSTDGNTWHTLNKTFNLVSLNANKVYVRIHIEGLKDLLADCDTISYSLNYNYYDPSLMSRGYLLRSTNAPSGNAFPQEFVIITTDNRTCVKTNDERGNTCAEADTIPGKTELCGSCETDITIPKDCTELGEKVQTDDVISKISAPEKVTKCIINHSDDAGNSYKASTCSGGVEDTNPYCSVWCKEDYATVRFSGIKMAQSGRYFKVNGRLEGTKTCYTSSGANSNSGNAIDVAKYEEDIAEAQKGLIEAYSELKKINTACDSHSAYGTVAVPSYHVGNNGQVVMDGNVNVEYSYDLANCANLKSQATERLNTAQSKYNAINEQFNSCTSWTNNFKFDQDIYYTYSENYSKLLNDEQTKMNKSCKGADCVTSTSNWFCSGDLAGNDRGRYNTCTTTPTNTVPTTTRSYIYCNASGCSIQSKTVSTAKYVKKAVNAAVDYTTNNQFYNIYTSGNITIQDVLDSDLNASLVDGSPVSVRTEIGVYTFKYEIRGLGEFYDTCSTGRLSGATNSVVNKLNKEGTIKFDGDYICYYTVDCPTCELICEGPDGGDCTWPDIECPTCEPVIIPANTMYSEDLKVDFRPVSVDDVDPNNREAENKLGYNWTSEASDTEYELISEKAEDTKKEIEETGALVEDSEPILSVTMTPQLAKQIKEYNKSQESNGGYANNSMVCYNYVDGSKSYDNVFCFSKFLDEMSNNSAFKFTGNRLPLSKRTDVKDASSLSKQIVDSGYWTVYKNYSKYELGKYDGVVGGPSWK